MTNKKTKFSLFPVLISVFITTSVIMVLFLSYHSPLADLYLPALGVVFVSFFWLTEFRTKAHQVEFAQQAFLVREYFGLGKQKSIPPSQIKGYIKTYQKGGAGKYEYLFLVNEEKRLISISEFYHRNFEELKLEIEQKVPFLGVKNYGFTEEYKEMFK